MFSLTERPFRSARELDNRTAEEIKASLENGVLRNNRNETYHRMSRGNARKNHSRLKQQEAKERDGVTSDINERIAALTQVQKENQSALKDLRAQKAQVSGKSGRSTYRAESSSSGKVKSSQRTKKARSDANPYPLTGEPCNFPFHMSLPDFRKSLQHAFCRTN